MRAETFVVDAFGLYAHLQQLFAHELHEGHRAAEVIVHLRIGQLPCSALKSINPRLW